MIKKDVKKNITPHATRPKSRVVKAAPIKTVPMKTAPMKDVPVTEKTEKKVITVVASETVRAHGRRKEAVARVRLMPQGQGKITINNKTLEQYFPYFELKNKVLAPLIVVNKKDSFDFTVKVVGGGKAGQAEAVRLGIARALLSFNDEYRSILRAEGLLTRDPRAKERKKFGLKRARRAPQWSKR